MEEQSDNLTLNDEIVLYNQQYLKTYQAKMDNPLIYNLASDFINRILKECYDRVNVLKFLDIERLRYYITLDDFSVKDGLEVICVIISKWSLSIDWYIKMAFTGRLQSDSTFYFYTVKWSVPNSSYPISQITVDIYFTVEILPNKPYPLHLIITYRMESERADLCALTTQFLEKWLINMFKLKEELFIQCTF